MNLIEGKSTLRETDIFGLGWTWGKHACADLKGVPPGLGSEIMDFLLDMLRQRRNHAMLLNMRKPA